MKAATGRFSLKRHKTGAAIALSDIMISIDRKLAELNTNSIGFDTQSIPKTQDIFQQLAE